MKLLKRNLNAVGITEIGKVGEDFNPEFHEALTTMPANSEGEKGKIAQVFESGFIKDGRVIRVAQSCRLRRLKGGEDMAAYKDYYKLLGVD